MRYSTISAIGSFTDVNTGSGDYLFLDPGRCSGGAGPDLRVTLEDKPGADGVDAFDTLDGSWIITLSGAFRASAFSGYDTLLADLKSALDAAKTANQTLTHAGGSLSFRFYSRIENGWENGLMTVTFGIAIV